MATTPSDTAASATQADDTLLAAALQGRPYGPGTQVLVIGVHGTNNGPGNVREVTERLGTALSDQPNVARAAISTGFDWSDLSTTTNQSTHRDVAAGRLTAHTLTTLDAAYRNGTLERGKPLVIVYVGFSHGGNVALQASPVTALGLAQRGITNAAIHDVTLSTPAYTWGEESPTAAARGVQGNGVAFAHTHFSVTGDGVIRGAIGNANYPGPGHLDANRRDGITTNVNLPSVSSWNGVANHGAPQDSDAHMDAVVENVTARFRGLAPATRRADADLDATRLAAADPRNANAFADSHPLRPTYEDIAQGVVAQGANALRGRGSDDIAATLLDRAVREGFDPARPIAVLPATQGGTLFAVQDQGPAAQRVHVDIDTVAPGTAGAVSARLETALAAPVVAEQAREQERARTV